jgi:hypothetical protein
VESIANTAPNRRVHTKIDPVIVSVRPLPIGSAVVVSPWEGTECRGENRTRTPRSRPGLIRVRLPIAPPRRYRINDSRRLFAGGGTAGAMQPASEQPPPANLVDPVQEAAVENLELFDRCGQSRETHVH